MPDIKNDLFTLAMSEKAQPLMDALGLVATSRSSLAVFNNAQDIEALITGLNNVLEILR